MRQLVFSVSFNKEEKIVEVYSKNGIAYTYEDTIGLPFYFSKVRKAVIQKFYKNLNRDEIIKELKDDFKEEDIIFYYIFVKKWNGLEGFSLKTSTSLKKAPDDIKDFILRNGLLHLVLCTTENCNLRCRYCTYYSDNYEYMRRYSERYMDFEIAKKAIDQFFLLLGEGKRYNPWRQHAIGFYGGEPLLNFNLIKRSVEYIEKEYCDYKIRYPVTTNATLLNEEKAEFLMSHNFSIAVSIDGPEEEHDRNRIYPNGKGSFRDVMKNASKIMEEGYDKIGSLAVFDWKSDLFKLQEFFNKEDVPKLMGISMPTPYMGCKYYDQFSKEDLQNYKEKFEKAKNYYFENLKNFKGTNSFFDYLFGYPAYGALFGGIALVDPNPIMPRTGACIPGRKIYVDVEGRFHTCEKINEAFPIGDVNKGLDFKKIAEMVSNYLDHLDRCSNCKVKRICNKCYCAFTTDKGFLTSSQVCKNVEDSLADSLSDAFTIGEIYPKFFDTFTSNYVSQCLIS